MRATGCCGGGLLVCFRHWKNLKKMRFQCPLIHYGRLQHFGNRIRWTPGARGKHHTYSKECCMRARPSSLFLVKSRATKMSAGTVFKTGERIPHSGIYRVTHRQHRVPHEVTLLCGQEFPKCAQCHDAVVFELVRGVTFGDDDREVSSMIRLYELPVVDDECDPAA